MKEVKIRRPSSHLPNPLQNPSPPKPPSFPDQRQALLAEAAPYRNEANGRRAAMGLTDEDAMLDELERRLGIQEIDSLFATERSQIAGFAVGRG